ncbi:hypothetical protein B9G98_04214 [Wickerhamiella sorbophila]|uniref:Uncharacterized protein n=1 Tax=Wickerhamiella sorbophila TaxID=45607 RepID=A0A2T0FNN5_9ASCO|nr:hypothetical protein B9G98_04214 [Wickerhamiella sorbophila]PRT56594.1 hypothetical protein B9G98_04214 [Wickerhamiella sorbophila]
MLNGRDRSHRASKTFSTRSISMLLNGGLSKTKRTDSAASLKSGKTSTRLNSQGSFSSLTSDSTVSSLNHSPRTPSEPASSWSCLPDNAPTLSLDFETSRHSDLAPDILLKPQLTSTRKVMKRNGSVYIFHGDESMNEAELFNPFEKYW